MIWIEVIYCSTKRPYIYRNGPSCIEHDLRGTIDGGADDVSSVICGYLFRNRVPQVTKLHGTESGIADTVINEDVIRFDIWNPATIRLSPDRYVLVCGRAKWPVRRARFLRPA